VWRARTERLYPAGEPPAGGGAVDDRDPELGPRARETIAMLWCCFLVASVGTMFFFAYIDPAPFADTLLAIGLHAGRMTLYSVGFFFFWVLCIAAAALTLWMTRGPR
jgi:hypothetical protein